MNSFSLMSRRLQGFRLLPAPLADSSCVSSDHPNTFMGNKRPNWPHQRASSYPPTCVPTVSPSPSMAAQPFQGLSSGVIMKPSPLSLSIFDLSVEPFGLCFLKSSFTRPLFIPSTLPPGLICVIAQPPNWLSCSSQCPPSTKPSNPARVDVSLYCLHV